MHIKFLDHGKGDASFASAYVLDDYDHKGNLRAGVEVLRGDANTFNHACSANPHEWKYTSGVIAWSKDDNPTPDEIREVLDKFEDHAFAGLDKSQYHLFAVLHTDDDGSKHIHVLVPRMDLVSDKSLNIAPPLHHHHFDPLRDKLNLEKGWSRPDDILLAKFTQEPNHVAKINRQAEKLLPNFEQLKKNQLRHVIDNHIRSLLGTEIQDHSDIIRVLRQLDGVKEVTNGKHVT
uniref:relaxase/mobilization nuclease domain-containing protein n=3 Tax=Moraxellaceae TaxID=468 RepID=UPI0012500CEF